MLYDTDVVGDMERMLGAAPNGCVDVDVLSEAAVEVHAVIGRLVQLRDRLEAMVYASVRPDAVVYGIEGGDDQS